MLPEKSIKMVHLQITKHCNLHCWFCGQWGNKGFFSSESGEPMILSEWYKVIDTLIRYRKETGISPTVMLWGGEPLVCPFFEEIVSYLYDNNFTLGMVTNGVLIDKHIETLKSKFKRIYISIDGPKKIHDSIRGEGVFDKVTANIRKIRGGKAEIIIMSVLSEALIDSLTMLPDVFNELMPSALYVQEMIGLNKNEVNEYKDWMKSSFGINARDIDSWQVDFTPEFIAKKDEAIKKLCANNYNINVKYLPHGKKTNYEFCLSPFRHVHVAWNGNVLYCTDFYDFCAGNVKENDLVDIFNNEKSEKYREDIANGKCATCNHCSWRNDREFQF